MLVSLLNAGILSIAILGCLMFINTPACGSTFRSKWCALEYDWLCDKFVFIVDLTSGKIISSRQLQIRDGKITAINPARTPITDKNHIYHDGNGKYVMPGLIDMHVHAYDLAAFVITLSHGVTHVRLMNGVKEHLVWRKAQ